MSSKPVSTLHAVHGGLDSLVDMAQKGTDINTPDVVHAIQTFRDLTARSDAAGQSHPAIHAIRNELNKVINLRRKGIDLNTSAVINTLAAVRDTAADVLNEDIPRDLRPDN